MSVPFLRRTARETASAVAIGALSLTAFLSASLTSGHAPAPAQAKPTPHVHAAPVQYRAPQSARHSAHHSARHSARHPEPRLHAASVQHPAQRITIPKWAIDLAADQRRRAGTPARPGSHLRAAHFHMSARDVRRLLRVSWEAFGYRGHGLEVRVARNSRQIRRESHRRPAVLQGYIGDSNDARPAGGLMQFVGPTFRHWRVAHRGDRFNPLDNILAAVNAQVHGPTPVLDGTSGWSPPMRSNPLHHRDSLLVA